VHIWPIIARSVPFPSLPQSLRLPWLHYCFARRHFNSSSNLNFTHSDICRLVRRYLNSLANLRLLVAAPIVQPQRRVSRQKHFLDFITTTSIINFTMQQNTTNILFFNVASFEIYKNTIFPSHQCLLILLSICQQTQINTKCYDA
jgi:hypothetical protein